mgnify:CR=1 FL=1
MEQYIEYSQEVKDALQNKKPIIAIETAAKNPITLFFNCASGIFAQNIFNFQFFSIELLM